MRIVVYPQITLLVDVEPPSEDLIRVAETCIVIVENLEAALLLNPTNYFTLYSLFGTCLHGLMLFSSNKRGFRFLITQKLSGSVADCFLLKLYHYAHELLDHPTVSEPTSGYEFVKCTCYFELARIFDAHRNYPMTLKYSKLAYEQCLRSTQQALAPRCKEFYLDIRAEFAKLPPLRFAVGDEVEFLREHDTKSEWKLGKVVELYYRERDFAINFCAPYLLQLLGDSGSTDQPPVYVWVKADIDRYVRKVGVKSIEDTRYQARLDAKVAELTRVYCSKELIQDIYHTLVQDREFVEMLRSVWQIELSVSMLNIYRMLVLYRLPLVRTDSGYHVPSSKEVIAEIKAYFDPAHLSGDSASSAVGENSYAETIRDETLDMFRGAPLLINKSIDDADVQGFLLQSIRFYIAEFLKPDTSGSYDQDTDFTVPSEVSQAIVKVSTANDVKLLHSDAYCGTKLAFFLTMWICIHICLDKPEAAPALESPFVYFFVTYCLDQGVGVPKLALAVYDRMNMQLSREFIRCANPTCELNKLDKSTGQVKFKKCSRCKAVIYCSRECQVAHYPEHKRLCRELATG